MAKHKAAVLGKAIRAAAGRDPAGPSDRELLRRFAAGEQAAFAALFRRHGGMVLGVCRRALPTVQDAEDACQATFLVLARRAGSGRWQSSVANWLYLTARRVAHNARIAARRRTRRERRAAVPESVQPVDRMTGRELLEVLDEEVGRLPASYREPLVLCYLEGLTRDEAAARLGLPPATVKIRLERGRKRLGEALARRGCVAGAGLLALAATSPADASPPRLVQSVLASASGQVPAAVAALARGVAGNGLVNKSVAALLVVAGAAALGLGLVSAGFPADRPAQEPTTGQSAAAERPQEKMAAPAGERPAPGAKAAEKRGQLGVGPASRTITGRVVGPDDKPVAGAKLFVPALHPKGPESSGTEARPDATADAAGRFTVTATLIDKDFPQLRLIAAAPGFGIDWLQFGGQGDPELPAEPVLRLTRDLPISGRVVNTEGKPVPGVAVSLFAVSKPEDDNLDAYLDGLKRNARDKLTMPQKSLYLLSGDLDSSTTTDKDGRFTVRGAGAERIVSLTVAGGGLAKSRVYVVTRAGFDPKTFGEKVRKSDDDNFLALNRVRGLYAPEFTFIAEPGKEITGTITDADTGEPIAGCQVVTFAGMGCDIRSVSDAGGRYRLVGVAKNERGQSVLVSPPGGTLYLGLNPRADDTEGLAPVRLDVRLAKGAVVTGRVIDRQTGKGLQGFVRLAPLPDNKFYKSKPGYDGYGTYRGGGGTGRDGRFRLATIPGPALVMAQVSEGETLNGQTVSPFRNAAPDPDHKDLFRGNGEQWTVVTAGNFVEFLGIEHALKVVDVKTTGETAVDLYVDRGVTGKLAVRDADGQPLAGARVAGLTDHWPITFRLPEPTATVYALDPARPRTLALYHPGKRLGGTVTIRGDEKEPVVARLGPLARATGRLLDADGRPLAGAEVSLDGFRTVESELFRFAAPAGSRTVTDKDGRFTLDGVVPGVRFYLRIKKGKDFYNSKPRMAWHRLEPRERFDFGDRAVAPTR
jgi:RNA polymerase sigma factor (sigma-70 family)